MVRFSRTLATVMSFTLCAVGTARAAYAPVDQPGPPLSVPTAQLAQALHCSTDLSAANRPPVLFIPGTALAPENYSWNWLRALDSMGWPYCSLALPDRGMNDIQVAGEYVEKIPETTTDYFSSLVATGEFPHVEKLFGRADARRMLEFFASVFFEEGRFRRGLDQLLDGVEANLSRRSGSRPRARSPAAGRGRSQRQGNGRRVGRSRRD